MIRLEVLGRSYFCTSSRRAPVISALFMEGKELKSR